MRLKDDEKEGHVSPAELCELIRVRPRCQGHDKEYEAYKVRPLIEREAGETEEIKN